MAIQINCSDFDLNEIEAKILERANEKLKSLNKTMTEQEMKPIVLEWIRPLQERFPVEFDLQDLEDYGTQFKDTYSDEENHLVRSEWKMLNNIWGWNNHNHFNFEKITHCDINSQQCWTDPIMRIFSRGYGFMSDNKQKASLSKSKISLDHWSLQLPKAYALWSVYFEQPGVLDIIEQIYRYNLTEESSYTFVNIVTFTRAWIEYCLFRDPDLLLDNIGELEEFEYDPPTESSPEPDELFSAEGSPSDKPPPSKRPAIKRPDPGGAAAESPNPDSRKPPPEVVVVESSSDSDDGSLIFVQRVSGSKSSTAGKYITESKMVV
jgi:hypothetical protein